MSKAINTLREHFNQRPVPNSKVLMEERYRVNAMVDAVEAENAKLRELVRDMRKAFFALDIDHCQACPRDTINGPCTKYLVGGSDECSFEEDMRELGVEVEV